MTSKFEEFFDAADADGSGKLTMKELGLVLRNKMHLDISADEILEMFQGLDENSDEMVTKAEYLKAMQKVPAKKMDKAELKQKFNALDKSGDGKLNAAEIKAMIKAQNKEWKDENIDKVMKSLDTTGDGLIDYNEFCDLLFT